MGTLPRQGRIEVFTDAPPDTVWTIVGDPTRVGEWSHECREAAWVDGATSARAGARFRGRNRTGRTRWSRVNEVLEVDAPRLITWRTVPSRLYPDSTEWHLELEPAEGGTRIIQTFQVLKLNPVLDRLFYLAVPQHRDRTGALTEDLRRLAAAAAGR